MAISILPTYVNDDIEDSLFVTDDENEKQSFSKKVKYSTKKANLKVKHPVAVSQSQHCLDGLSKYEGSLPLVGGEEGASLLGALQHLQKASKQISHQYQSTMKSSLPTSRTPNRTSVVQDGRKRNFASRSTLSNPALGTISPISPSARNRNVKLSRIVHQEVLNSHPVDRIYEKFLLQNSPSKDKPATLVAKPPTHRAHRQRQGANRFGPECRVKRRVVVPGTGYQGTARPTGLLTAQRTAVPQPSTMLHSSLDGAVASPCHKVEDLVVAATKRQYYEVENDVMNIWKKARDALLLEGVSQEVERPTKRPFQELEDPAARVTSWTGAGNAFERRW